MGTMVGKFAVWMLAAAAGRYLTAEVPGLMQTAAAQLDLNNGVNPWQSIKERASGTQPHLAFVFTPVVCRCGQERGLPRSSFSRSLAARRPGSNDLLRIYFVTQRDEVDYNLAYIGSDFSAPKPGYFDKAYINALFEYAYQQARRGYPWQKEPPLLASQR